MLKEAAVLGLQINSQDELTLYRHFFEVLDKNEYKSQIVVTPNPEIAVHAYNNKRIRNYLNKADISLADGFGLAWVSRWIFGKKVSRITGADLLINILKELNQRPNSKIFILDWVGGLSSQKEIYLGLTKKFPNIQIKIKQIERNENLNPEFWQEIANYPSDLFICTLGNPYQEEFLIKNKNRLNTKWAMALGASIDFIIGKQWRAPKILRKLGLEWLFRWLQKPLRRSKRMFNALIVFPALSIKWWFRSKFSYRPNVITLLYRENGDVLIANKIHKAEEKRGFGPDWEIPQGGIEKAETIKEAAIRELREELGVLRDVLEVKKIEENIWQYAWQREGLPNSYCFYKGYKGQRQSLAIVKLLKDSDFNLISANELKDFRWVKADEALETINPLRRAGSSKVIKIFKEYFDKLHSEKED